MSEAHVIPLVSLDHISDAFLIFAKVLTNLLFH